MLTLWITRRVVRLFCACGAQVTEERLKEIFDYFDANESGDIDRYELDGLLDFFQLGSDDGVSAAAVMERLDVNRDGTLSKDEWLDFMLHEIDPPLAGIPGDPLHITVRYHVACSRYSRVWQAARSSVLEWLAVDEDRKLMVQRNIRLMHWWHDFDTQRQLYLAVVLAFGVHAVWRYAGAFVALARGVALSVDDASGSSVSQQAAAIFLLPLLIFGAAQLVYVFVPSGKERYSKWLILAVALAMYQTISRWSAVVSFDTSITINALDLSLGEILIFTAVVDHFQKMRAEQIEKREQQQDWIEHAADRRRVNVSLNTIDERGRLALRTLREQSLYEVFPSKHVADRLIEAAAEIDPEAQARAPSGALIVIEKGRLFSEAKATHKRLVDQLTNYISAINGSGFIDKDCGAPAIEENYVFGLTFEKGLQRAKSAANEKFKILLVREDLLSKAHLRTAEDVVDPRLHPMAQEYFKTRWRQLQDMADYYFQRETPLSPQARTRTVATRAGWSSGSGSETPCTGAKRRRDQLLLMSAKNKPLMLVAKGERSATYSVPWANWGGGRPLSTSSSLAGS